MTSNGSRAYRVGKSPIAGRGVFATRRIPKGTRIVEYVGERITPEEADERYDDDTMDVHHTFLFIVDDDTIVDAAVGGNAARFINHSCDPNCEAAVEDGRIWVTAIKDIAPGAELVYDYAYERAGHFKKSYWELYACRCGAKKCRGIILKKPKPPKRRAATRASSKRTTRAARRAAPKRAGRARAARR
ncbi:MAG: SET domain-containing protein [Gemmatimonadaceae bacterium]